MSRGYNKKKQLTVGSPGAGIIGAGGAFQRGKSALAPHPSAQAYAHANPNARFLRGNVQAKTVKRQAISGMLKGEQKPTFNPVANAPRGIRPQYGGAALQREGKVLNLPGHTVASTSPVSRQGVNRLYQARLGAPRSFGAGQKFRLGRRGRRRRGRLSTYKPSGNRPGVVY